MKFGRRILFTFVFILLGLTLLVALARRGELPTTPDPVSLNADGFRVGGEQEDLVQIGASPITLLPDTVVAGDAALIALGGQPVVVDGSVAGDLTIIGGDVTLNPKSVVSGDAFIIGGQISLLGQIDGDVSLSGDRLMVGEGAVISGVIDSCDIREVSAPAALETSTCAPIEAFSPAFSFLGALVSGVLFAGISTLAVIIFPRQIAQMEDAMRRRPLRLTGAGVALGALAIGITAAIALVTTALPLLGLVGVPLFLLMTLGLGVMTLFGGVPIYILFGDWLLARLRVQAPPLVAVLVGAVSITLVLALLSTIPVVMWFAAILWLLLVALSLGTAFDTRLGTRNRQRSYFVQG
jgi:hypothetical protein